MEDDMVYSAIRRDHVALSAALKLINPQDMQKEPLLRSVVRMVIKSDALECFEMLEAFMGAKIVKVPYTEQSRRGQVTMSIHSLHLAAKYQSPRILGKLLEREKQDGPGALVWAATNPLSQVNSEICSDIIRKFPESCSERIKIIENGSFVVTTALGAALRRQDLLLADRLVELSAAVGEMGALFASLHSSWELDDAGGVVVGWLMSKADLMRRAGVDKEFLDEVERLHSHHIEVRRPNASTPTLSACAHRGNEVKDCLANPITSGLEDRVSAEVESWCNLYLSRKWVPGGEVALVDGLTDVTVSWLWEWADDLGNALPQKEWTLGFQQKLRCVLVWYLHRRDTGLWLNRMKTAKWGGFVTDLSTTTVKLVREWLVHNWPTTFDC